VTGPLTGLRVLDFSRVLAGPFCTMVLADLGADVLKVERPETGDDTRAWGPPFAGGDAAYFLSVNRNKRSVALDLGAQDGVGTARALARKADVVVENFRPGLMERFGLNHDALRRDNPRLVYCSILAFPEGPRRDDPGYDLTFQALSGLMSITGPKDGEPTKVGVAILDVAAGLFAAVGILAALRERERTGRGTYLEVPLFDASLAVLVNQAANHLIGGMVPGPMGNEHPNIVPYQDFRASDRTFVVAAGNDRLFTRLCEAIDRPEWAEDPRFVTNEARVGNREQLISMLAEVFASGPAEEWLRLLEDRGVPCAPVRSLDEVFSSPEGARCVEEVGDQRRGLLRLVRSPFYGTGPLPTGPPPILGDTVPGIWDLAADDRS
jgi:crotonobetainyl-CoA:carnitine CoA-transferase CaiB-like acyl-CoA transferase